MEGRDYVVGADVASGKVKDKVITRRRINSSREDPDYSAAVVLDVISGEHVATWHGWDNTTLFAQALYAIGLEYNNALVVPELNGPGTAVVEHMTKVLEYPNVYMTKTLAKSQMVTESEIINYGWWTTPASKEVLIMLIREQVEGRECRTRDLRLAKELRKMQYDDTGNPRARGRDNDDLVMAYGLALRGRFELLVGLEKKRQEEQPKTGPDEWVWKHKDKTLKEWAARRTMRRARMQPEL